MSFSISHISAVYYLSYRGSGSLLWSRGCSMASVAQFELTAKAVFVCCVCNALDLITYLGH